MAGEINEDLIREQVDNSRQQNEELAALRRQIAQLNVALGRTLTAEQKKELNFVELGEQVEEFGAAIESTNPYIRAQARALEDSIKKLQNLNEAITTGSNAFKDGFKNLISQSDRSFGKYNSSIEGLADAASRLAGPIFGAFISAAGKVSTAMFTQYDNLLKTTDSLSKVGATAGMTTSEFRDLAHASNVTSKNLDIFAKPLKGLGVDLTLLANNATDGAREFAKLTAISTDQVVAYQRLGISQEELIQNQADYIALQGAMGKNIRGELADRGKLQRETLAYTDSLMELASLTGQDVESIKKKQKEAADDLTFQISIYKLNRQIQEAKAKGDKEEVERLTKQRETQGQVLKEVAGLNNEFVTKGVRQMIATGTIAGEESAVLARMGLLEDVERLGKVIKEGGNAQEASRKFQDEYNKKFRQTLDATGTAVQYNNEIGKSYGQTAETVKQANRDMEKNYEEEGKLVKDRIKEQKEAGKDIPKDARALLTKSEIAAGKAVDDLTGSATMAAIAIAGLGAASAFKAFKLENIKDSIAALGSKLGSLGRIGASTVPAAGAGPIAAAAPAAAAVSPLRAARIQRVAEGRARQAAAAAVQAPAAASAATGAAAPAAAAATGAAATAKTLLSKLAFPVTALYAVTEGMQEAASGIKDANKELAEGKISVAEAKVKKSEAVGSGVGTAGGTVAGALIGQALIPIPGLGAVIGGAIGSWAGSKLGKATGSLLGQTTDEEKQKQNQKEEQEKAKDLVSKVNIINPLPLPVAIVKGLEPIIKVSSLKPEQQEKLKFGSDFPILLANAFLGPAGTIFGKNFKTIIDNFDNKATNADELKDLLKQRETVVRTGPTDNSIQSKIQFEKILASLDDAIQEKEKLPPVVKKEKLDLPKAQDGGSFSGPKEGYPVILHGDEDVIPRKDSVTKKPLENVSNLEKKDTVAKKSLENVSNLEKKEIVIPKPKNDLNLTSDLASNISEKVMKKIMPEMVNFQRLTLTQNTKQTKNQETNKVDLITKFIDFNKIFTGLSEILDKTENINRDLVDETKFGETFKETATLLNPAVKMLNNMNTGTQIINQQFKDFKQNQIEKNELDDLIETLDNEEVTESSEKLSVTFNSSDKALTALTGNIIKYNKIVEDLLADEGDDLTSEIKSDLKHVAVGVNKDFQNSFKGAYVQLENFKRKFIEVTDTAMQGGPGREIPVKTETGVTVTDSAGKPVVTRPEAPIPVKQDVKENLKNVAAALKKRGMGDEKYTNAVLANIMKETGGKLVEENLDYSRTSNERIRSIFSGASDMSDAQLEEIKRDKQKMAELMYGSKSKTGKMLGNLEPGDGWRFRGRGYIQLTGRANYAAASKAIFGDDRLVDNPDLVNSPAIAADVVAWFMERNKKSMAGKLGIDTASMSQQEANLLATSQIAGRAIKPGKGYLGQELLGKVEGYSQKIASSGIATGSSSTGSGTTPSGSDVSGSTRMASVTTKRDVRPLEGSHAGETNVATADTSGTQTKDPREQIEKAGLKVRPYGDVFEGGPLTDTALQLAKTIQDAVPDFMFYTGLNDKFHQEKHPSSKHALGRGLDFKVSKTPSPEEASEIKELIKKMPGVSLVLNEYYPPPHGDANRNTTGPHFHVQTSARNGAEIDGPEAGYPVDLTAHGREVIAPLDQSKILGMLANTNVTPQVKEIFDPATSSTKNDNTFMESMTQYMETHKELMDILTKKLDDVVGELETSNKTQGDLLKQSRV